MENELLNLTSDKELRTTSVELVDIINQFRHLESDKICKEYIELKHKTFMEKIRKELEVLKSVGLKAEQNILPSEYKDSTGRNMLN
ncbi:hypothetical protein EXM65_14330 [Clostridium botulinum]|uniref:Uncharacterized protein n=1 Tax=Clostridium botulinum TaxID=1491 RepID=A0A6M0STL1_CLOBO|nr:hypothetical protein [Clostridium botulinum]